MRKILFIIGRLDTTGGEERSLSLLCNTLLQKKPDYDITIVCLEGDKDVYPLDERIKVIYLLEHANTRLRRVIKLRKIACSGSYNLIAGYGKTARLPACIAARSSKLPLVYCERLHPYFENDTLKRRLWRFSGMRLLRGQYGVFQSQGVSGYYTNLREFKVIPNMLDVDLLPDIKPWVERENIVISAGRLTAQKNIETLIRAFFEHGDGSRVQFTLEIYGDGEQREQLERLTAELGAQADISIKPASADIFEHMNNAKIYVCSSIAEGYPNALLEAMAMGMACISTDCSSAVSELIEDGVNGLIVPVDDENAMTEALKKLTDDDILAQQLSKRAEKVRQTNAKETLIDEWISFFEKIRI